MRGFRGRFLSALFGAALLFAAASPAADKKEKPKPAKVELQGLKITVNGSHVSIDGALHNSGDKTIQRLVLAFHFFDSEHQPVTTLKMEVDEETIHPGDDAEIHAEANEPPRSISLEVTASARGEKELTVVNPGPYPIE